MTRFYAISNFRERIAQLLKVKRKVYSGVEDEISDAFANRDIDEIRQNRDMILICDNFIIIKLRLPDKKQKLSKRDGYRLIYIASKVTDAVVFLDIYPKNGPSQQLDITQKELENLLRMYLKELNNNELHPQEII